MKKNQETPIYKNELANLRERYHLSQEDIGKVLGVHRGYVSRLENGKVQITYRMHRQLKEEYGWTASMIFGDEEVSGELLAELEKVRGLLERYLVKEFDKKTAANKLENGSVNALN